jgi:hypothetical protein
MGDEGKTYDHARAAVQLWWERHNLPSSGTAGMPMGEMLDHLTMAAVNAIAEMGKPRVSPHGMAAFERLASQLPNDSYEVQLVRQELTGRAPLRDDKLPDALRERLGVVRGDNILELLRTHGWGPLKRPGGRRRTAPTKLGYCPRHGASVELRQYANGKQVGKYAWRCVLCLNAASKRHRQNSR